MNTVNADASAFQQPRLIPLPPPPGSSTPFVTGFPDPFSPVATPPANETSAVQVTADLLSSIDFSKHTAAVVQNNAVDEVPFHDPNPFPVNATTENVNGTTAPNSNDADFDSFLKSLNS